MGRRPKRTEQRLGHRTQAEQDRTTTVTAKAGEVEIPAPLAGWDPIAVRWYESLGESGTEQFMEPSDWAAAAYVAEVMTRNLKAERFSGQLFSGVWTAMSDLLTSESARRKAHIEIDRRGGGDPAETPDNVTDIGDFAKLYG